MFTVAPNDFGTCAFIVPSISVSNDIWVLSAKVLNLICCEWGSGINCGWVVGYFINIPNSANFKLNALTSYELKMFLGNTTPIEVLPFRQ